MRRGHEGRDSLRLRDISAALCHRTVTWEVSGRSRRRRRLMHAVPSHSGLPPARRRGRAVPRAGSRGAGRGRGLSQRRMRNAARAVSQPGIDRARLSRGPRPHDATSFVRLDYPLEKNCAPMGAEAQRKFSIAVRCELPYSKPGSRREQPIARFSSYVTPSSPCS